MSARSKRPRDVWFRLHTAESLFSERDALFSERDALRDLAEQAWTVIASAGGGDWDKETRDWRQAAKRFRARYHKLVLDARRVGCKGADISAIVGVPCVNAIEET